MQIIHFKPVAFRGSALFILIFGMMLIARCDSSFVPDVEPPLSEVQGKRVEAVKEWYLTALSKEQSAPPVLPDGAAGKIGNDSTIAAVLAAMVRKYPPDWDKMETWSDGKGGYLAATLLGSNQPMISPSDSRLSVIRTLIADVDSDGKILTGQLVEFVGIGLKASLLQDYVKMWLAGDFDELQILVAEYSIGYASTQAFLYKPDEKPQSIAMKLARKTGTGKTNTEWTCWITDGYSIEMCKPVPVGMPDSSECVEGETIEISCVESFGGGHGDGDKSGGRGDRGEDGGNGERNSGGSNGDSCSSCSGDGDEGDDDADEDEGNEEKLRLVCDPSVQRGSEGVCKVISESDLISVESFTFNWSSSFGAQGTGYSWRGIATETASITVTASTGWAQTDTIEVTARQWNPPSERLNIEEKYSELPRLRSSTSVGFYRLIGSASAARAISNGTGPWEGRFYLRSRPTIQGELHVAKDYDPSSIDPPKYPLNGTLCPSVQQGNTISSANYLHVNSKCGTSSAFKGFRHEIIRHEKEHAAGHQQCLDSYTTTKIFIGLEKLTGTQQELIFQTSDPSGSWAVYWNKLMAAGEWASDINYSKPFYRYHSQWVYGTFFGGGHSASTPC